MSPPLRYVVALYRGLRCTLLQSVTYINGHRHNAFMATIGLCISDLRSRFVADNDTAATCLKDRPVTKTFHHFNSHKCNSGSLALEY